MPAERDWNDVIDLELDGCEAAGARRNARRALTSLRRLRWRA